MKNNIEYSEARGYNLGMARELGITPAAVFNQLLFWQKIQGKDQWFYKSYDDMIQELPFSTRTLRTAYQHLEKAGYIETTLAKANGAPTLHFRICRYAIMESANIAETKESANIAETINNKTHNKTHSDSAENDTLSQKTLAAYRLYLKQFIIPYKLPETLKNATDAVRLAAAEKRYHLTPKRREAIKRRLEDAGYEMLCGAILGYSRNPWYVGDNDRDWVADLQEFICRSYENVEKGAGLYEQQKQKPSDPFANL